jgi:hypothetical protein
MGIDVTGSLDFDSNSKYPKAGQKEIAAGTLQLAKFGGDALRPALRTAPRLPAVPTGEIPHDRY